MSSPGQNRKRLDGWKAIGDYLGLVGRTAQRYEAKGLPVYRIAGCDHARVFAFSDELDLWMQGRGKPADLPESPAQEASSAPRSVCPLEQILRLEILKGEGLGASLVITESETVLGRNPRALLPLSDTRISRRHVLIRRGPQGILIEDLGSRNGTQLNNQPLLARTPLRNGDCLCLGGAVELGVTLTNPEETVGKSAKQSP